MKTITLDIDSKLKAGLIEVNHFNAEMEKVLVSKIADEAVPNQVKVIINAKPKRVGYVVATCCPTTRAHIELARQAIERLNLDRLIFIIWPFHYIPGFHRRPLDAWVTENGYIDWEQRIEMLRIAIEHENDERIVALDCAKEWYIQSECMFDPENENTAFWTGSWYVIRKLQHYLLNNGCDDTEFFFVCGEDQFNPNIYALFDSGTEKVWKDYSIIHQLAIHNVYAIPRGTEKSIEQFLTPEWCQNKVIYGTKLKHNNVSASEIRNSKCFSTLTRDCCEAVVSHLLAKGYWSYQV